MAKDIINKKKLINLLIKKATGFYYSEEQFEYENNQINKKSISKLVNLNIDNLEKNANLINLNEKNSINNNNSTENAAKNETLDDFFENEKKVEKNLKKSGRGSVKTSNSSDIMEVSNDESAIKNDDENLKLIKRKVSTHFVPPDMIAIKILFEIFEKKVNSDEIENMTDDELLNLKSKLLEELKDENF